MGKNAARCHDFRGDLPLFDRCRRVISGTFRLSQSINRFTSENKPMTYEDLIRQLRKRRALIVHFSHHANTRKDGVFPADLHAAALNSRLWPLSTSVVWPSHNMSLVGSVGLVLHPRSLASIIGVKASDAGYSTNPVGDEQGMGKPLDQDSFDRSFDVASGGYNEWRVQEADVIGVYWEATSGQLHAKKLTILKDLDTGASVSVNIGIHPISVPEVHASFPDLPAYTRLEDQIVASNIPGSVLYPWSLNGTGRTS